MTRRIFLLVPMVMMCAALSLRAGELPVFKDDQAADTWLRKTSLTYRKMAEAMDARGGYTLRNSNEFPRSMMLCDQPKPVVVLNDHMVGATRVTLMIFEFSNASQADKFRELTASSASDDASEYAIMHMLLEYESLRLHRQVLTDLNKALGGVPPEMFQVFLPTAKSFAEYDLPNSYDYIKLRKGTAYRKYYEDWFHAHAPKKAATAVK